MNPLRAVDWYQMKLLAQHASGFSMDALHVLAGAVLLFIIAALLRSSVARPLPLVLVFVLELLNEANDFHVEIWPQPGMQFGEALKDIILTMSVPMLIFLVARYRPKLIVQTPS